MRKIFKQSKNFKNLRFPANFGQTNERQALDKLTISVRNVKSAKSFEFLGLLPTPEHIANRASQANRACAPKNKSPTGLDHLQGLSTYIGKN